MALCRSFESTAVKFLTLTFASYTSIMGLSWKISIRGIHMASNNLRIIYQNHADLSTTTITASSTASGATTTANLKSDTKSLVWRSATSSIANTAKANLLVNFTTPVVPGGVVFPFCNLSSVATVRVRGFTGTSPTLGGTVDSPSVDTTGATEVFDTGAVIAAPYQPLGLWNWGSLPLGVNSYSYGGGTYGRVWIAEQSQMPCTSMVIEIIDTYSTSQYIEASRLIIGSYWSPKYNTEYGLSTTMKDTSVHERTESGDLISNRGVQYNSMNFDLKSMVPADRLELTRIMRGNGTAKPLFISLFPDNSTDYVKEQAHQIYGKMPQLDSIGHPIFETYSSTVEIEEI